MKIVLTKEELKNIVADFVNKHSGYKAQPQEVKFTVSSNDIIAEVIY